MATVVGLIALASILEPAVYQVAPEVGRFGPMAGAPGGVLGGLGPDELAPGLAVAVLIAWVGAAFFAGAWRLRSRDLV